MTSTNIHQAGRVSKRAGKKHDTNKGYDKAVHAGERREENDDIYERSTRAALDVDGDIAENLAPEELVAALEGKSAVSSADDIAEDLALESPNLEQEGIALAAPRIGEDDDDGSVSPEELGEQFLRHAAQQERRTHANDRESNDNVDLSTDSVHQVSLFDHNQDPLADPRFPRVSADETSADAAHGTGGRAAAKRAAIQNAQDQSAGRAEENAGRRKGKQERK